MRTQMTLDQVALYYESINKPGMPVFVVPCVFALDDSVDLQRMKAAVETVVEAYPVMGMCFSQYDDGTPCFEDCREKVVASVENLTTAQWEELISAPPKVFDFDGGPLFVARIVRTPEGKWLYICFHHSICDGSSVRIIVRDIAKAYNGESVENQGLTPAEAFAQEQERQKSAAHDEAVAWYKDVFLGIDVDSTPLPDVLEDNSTNTAPLFSTVRRKKRTLVVEHPAAFARSRELGVPMSILFDGAFGYMIGTWNATSESLFCTIHNGRVTDAEKQSVLMLVRTIPIYCQWDADTTVADYLKKLAEQNAKALRYARECPYAEVCALTGIAPQLNFSYRGSVQVGNFIAEGVITSGDRIGFQTNGESLLFLLDHVNGKLEVKVEYQSAQYTEAFIDSMLEAYSAVLKGFMECERLADIQFCSPEMEEKLEAVNKAETGIGDGETIVDRFRHFAHATPDKIALKTDDIALTFKQVENTAERLAAHINSLGIGSGDVVSVLIGRNEYMLTATLGVLFSGAAYEPLDSTYPAERLNYMMSDAGVSLLIKDRDVDIELDADLKDKVHVLYTDEIASLEAKQLQHPEKAKVTLDSPFIILYTSGTTGTPKGTRLTHGNLMALCRQQRNHMGVSADERWCMYASYGFDAGFFCLLVPMSAGASIAIVPEEVRLDIEALNAFFKRNEVNIAFMTTQVGRIFYTSVGESPIKKLIVGGERLVPCEPRPDMELYNAYGPTECTVYCHYKKVDRLYKRVPVGMHTTTFKNYIVDTLGRRMPLGAMGEMLIAGPQVGMGYINLPEKTAAVFCPNPFDHEKPYDRVYHTGDIARLLPATGEADIIGRNDGQVKVRGFRIELPEVEKVVREFPGIKDATVQAFDSPAGGKFIAAYIVADTTIDIDALNDFIGSQKPPYMIPAVTMQIEAIPLTQNQKVNKRALPEPKLETTQQASGTSINRKPNILEQAIIAIVNDVLKIDDVSLDVPLALVGLTSISSIRLASLLFKRFGVNIKGADLVKTGTVLSIEDSILEKLLATQDQQPAAQRKAITSSLLTVSQQGVYADTMRNPDTTAYNVPIYLRFDASTDAQALADAVVKIVDAHPYLRDVHLAMGDVDIVQTVEGDKPAVSVPVLSMSEDEVADYRKHFIRSFDLMAAPLYRFEVIGTPKAVYLLIDVQHIAFDGSSLSVFLTQLKTLLEGGTIESEQYSYLDYAEHERQWLEGKDGENAAAYFKQLLADCEAASDIPADKPQTGDAGERGIITCPINTEKVDAFCNAHGITPAALYLAATSYATARYTNSRAAYISTISTGRNDNRFGDTFGMFVKTLPFALTMGETSALDYALKAKQTLTEVVDNEMYPYVKICTDYNYAPNIVYEYQRGLVDDYTINGKTVERRLFDIDTLKFKIGVRVEDINGVPSVAIHYRRGIYSDELMSTYCHAITVVANSIIDNPQQPIRKMSMLTADQATLLKQYASTDIDQYSDKCFHNLMEEQAALHPNRKAVVACDRTLTYAELDRTANIVANNLIAKGVKKGDKVVLLLSRTSRFFTSAYGVLKAGAAYIPSSPDYPEERKNTIIEDAQAAYVITDENADELHMGDNCTKPNVEVSPDDLVYLIYTSGSTGKPKGVLLRHRGIVNYVTPVPSIPHAYAMVNNCSVVGSITTVAFDLSLKEWGFALSNGLTLVFASDEQTNDPIALAALFKENKVDYFGSTPSRVLQYLDLDDFQQMLSACKVVVCGGELYPLQLLNRLQTIAPNASLFNTYGPTEITVSSNGAPLNGKNAVTVGAPLRNYVEHIVDLDDNLVPAGVMGELLISGHCIAAGYNNRPEQTAAAFITYDGLPTYRSGDLARWNSDGEVVILGRKDTQVKIRGLRIELGEIDRVLTEIDGVSASHIMVRNVANRENLVAYYTLKPGCTLTPDDIKARMAEKLADYMVPAFCVHMEQMPITPNGKINARALPEPVVAKREAGQAATSELEKFFVNVFKEILGTDTVYADDSFFALGGTSLTATRVMIAASKAGHRIVYADVFGNPSPAAIAHLIESRQHTDAASDNTSPTAQLICPDYDYTAINKLLAENTLDNFKQGKRHELGNVLLAGATGFAGIHVLRELLTQYDVKVYCLCRDGRDGRTAAERIESLYFYYFSEPLAETYPDRLIVVNGDITKPDTLMDLKDIDTVINCAANVKHFSAGTDIEDINYYGVLNLIELCKRTGAQLMQTSTHSVCGQQPMERNDVLSERDLYIGQDFSDNKYVISKFAAERAVLEATAKGEITGKVVRLGNLAPREVDGEFQINASTNGFMNRLKSLYLIGCYPYSMYNTHKDISPIDDVARAIVLFTQTPDKCVLFHGNNFNRVSLGYFYARAMNAGLPLRVVETEEYLAALEVAKSDPKKLDALVGFMAYEGTQRSMHAVDYTNEYSNQVLLRMGFEWPVISSAYIDKTIDSLMSIGFFL